MCACVGYIFFVKNIKSYGVFLLNVVQFKYFSLRAFIINIVRVDIKAYFLLLYVLLMKSFGIVLLQVLEYDYYFYTYFICIFIGEQKVTRYEETFTELH